MLQALILSTRHHGIKDANLSGRKLTAIMDLLLKQYQQVSLLLPVTHYSMLPLNSLHAQVKL